MPQHSTDTHPSFDRLWVGQKKTRVQIASKPLHSSSISKRKSAKAYPQNRFPLPPHRGVRRETPMHLICAFHMPSRPCSMEATPTAQGNASRNEAASFGHCGASGCSRCGTTLRRYHPHSTAVRRAQGCGERVSFELNRGQLRRLWVGARAAHGTKPTHLHSTSQLQAAAAVLAEEQQRRVQTARILPPCHVPDVYYPLRRIRQVVEGQGPIPPPPGSVFSDACCSSARSRSLRAEPRC